MSALQVNIDGAELIIDIFELFENLPKDRIEGFAEVCCYNKVFANKLVELLSEGYYGPRSDEDLYKIAKTLIAKMGNVEECCLENLEGMLKSAEDSRHRAWEKMWRLEKTLEKFYQMERTGEHPWYQERLKADLGKLGKRFA